MRSALVLLMLLSAASLTSCGGRAADMPPSSDVAVTITPASSTIRVNTTVDLTGTVTGLSGSTLDWWQQEHHDSTGINGSSDCDYVSTVTAYILSTCTAGYLTGPGMIEATSSVETYHAPATPGTYHVMMRAFKISSLDWTQSIEKRTTATITVTP